MIDLSNESPLSETLRRFSIGTGEAATLAGCTCTEISRARAGGPIPSKLANALERLRVDTVDLNQRQAEYRRRRAASIEQRLQTRMMAGACNK